MADLEEYPGWFRRLAKHGPNAVEVFGMAVVGVVFGAVLGIIWMAIL